MMPGTNEMAMSLGVGAHLDASAFHKEWKAAQSKIEKSFGNTMARALETSFSPRHLAGLEKSFDDISTKIHTSMAKSAELQGVIRTKTQANLDTAAEKALLLQEKIRESGLQKRLKTEIAEVDKVAKKRVAAQKRWGRLTGKAEGFEKGASGFMGSIGQLRGGDVGGFLKGAGKGAGKAGQGLIGKDTGGGIGKALGGIGKALAGIAPALMAIGAIAGGLAMIAKIIIDADAQQKEFNTTLLKSNTSVADLGENFGDVEGKLHETTEAFNKFAFNRRWGTLPKDGLEIADAFNQAGFTLKKMVEGTITLEQRQEKLRKVTESALTYANLLGMRGPEVATKMGDYMDNLGMSIESVEDSFAGMHSMAKESGYSTKRFFGMVLQATSGITMYNVRLEETASLLKSFTGALGQAEGMELFQKLLGMEKGKGVMENLKTEAIVGKPLARKRWIREGQEQAQAFLEELRRNPERNLEKSFANAAKAAGVQLDLTSGKTLRRSLRSLSRAERKRLDREFALRKGTGGEVERDTVRRFRQLQDQTQRGAFEGLGYAGTGGPIHSIMTQMDKMQRAMQMGGGDVTKGAAAAESLGLDLETFKRLRIVKRDTEAQMAALQELQRKATAEGKGYGAEEQERQLREYGAKVVMKGGKASVVSAKDKPIEEMSDLLYAQQDRIAKLLAAGAVSRDRQIAMLTARNTTDMTKILQQGIAATLGSIFGVVKDIRDWVTGSDKERNVKLGINKAFNDQASVLEKERFSYENEIGELKKALLKGNLDTEGKVEAEQQIESLQEKIKGVLEKEEDVIKRREEYESLDPKEQMKVFNAIMGSLYWSEEDLRRTPEVIVHGTESVKWVAENAYDQDKSGLLGEGYEGDFIERIRRLSAVGRAGGKEEREAREEREASITADGGVGGEKAEDALIRFTDRGMSVQRIDQADVLTAAKPGGALSQMGGGAVVHNHWYSGSKDTLNSIRQWQRLLGQRQEM